MIYLRKHAELSDCGKYRFVLSREWEQGEGRCCFIMLNPSTADASKDDPTVRKCVAFAKRWGHKALDIVNLFALRTPNPKELRGSCNLLGPFNPSEQLYLDIWTLSAAARARTAVAAWGRHGKLFQRDRVVLNDLLRGVKLWCLGENSDGTPKHPLYLPYGTPLIPFGAREETEAHHAP